MKCPDCKKEMRCTSADGDLISFGGDFAEWECECGLSMEVRREATITRGKDSEWRSSLRKTIEKHKKERNEKILAGEVEVERGKITISGTDVVKLLSGYRNRKVYLTIFEC
jgi:hypothetical protein